MATANITTSSSGSINFLRMDLYKATDPTSILSTLQYPAPHPQREWSFYNLIPNENYIYRLTESNGTSILQQYIKQNFTMPAAGNLEIKDSVSLVVDLDPGLNYGANTAIFDGTNGTLDLRGWEVNIERRGIGFLRKTFEYSWNVATGKLTLLDFGDIFQTGETFFFLFTPKVVAGSNQTVVNAPFTDTLVITANTTLTALDQNKNIVIEGASTYLEITLDEITTFAPNKPIYFDSSIGNHICAVISSSNGNLIKWMEGQRTHVYIGRSESIAFYRHQIDANTNVWRIKFPYGNFLTVGQTFTSYANQASVFNSILLDGGLNGDFLGLDKFEYARLYNDHVLKQPISNLVSYAQWGNSLFPLSKYKFSFADPNTGRFRIPDTRDLFERNASINGVGGEFRNHTMLNHQHEGVTGTLPSTLFGSSGQIRLVGKYNGTGTGPTDLTGPPILKDGVDISKNIGTETAPMHYTIPRYILV